MGAFCTSESKDRRYVMVARHAIWKRFWSIVVVLVSLLAQLLPAAPYSVFAQAATCGGAGLRSATMAAGAVVADDQEVEIPQETLDLAVYTANWRYKLKDAALVEGLVFDLFLLNTL
jgi:hypothetical protein